MEDLLEQIEAVSAAGLHYVAVWSALTIPDFCGALGYPNGLATGQRYRKWWDANMPDYRGQLPGSRAWEFRCSMLHQGSARHSQRASDWVLLMEPSEQQAVLHLVQLEDTDSGDIARVIHAPRLVRDLVAAARAWLEDHSDDPVVKKNIERFVRRHPDGVAPYVIGTALIG